MKNALALVTSLLITVAAIAAPDAPSSKCGACPAAKTCSSCKEGAKCESCAGKQKDAAQCPAKKAGSQEEQAPAAGAKKNG